MIKFENREEQKKYSFLVSSLNIDFSHLNYSLGRLFSLPEEGETPTKVEDVCHLLKDISTTACDLEKCIEKKTQ